MIDTAEQHRKRYSYQWALERAQKEYPDFNWTLGVSDYGFTVGLACEKGEHRRGVQLARLADNFSPEPTYNMNDLPFWKMEEAWQRMMKNLTGNNVVKIK